MIVVGFGNDIGSITHFRIGREAVAHADAKACGLQHGIVIRRISGGNGIFRIDSEMAAEPPEGIPFCRANGIDFQIPGIGHHGVENGAVFRFESR